MSRFPSWMSSVARSRLLHFTLVGGALYAIAPSQRPDVPVLRVEARKASQALARARAEAGRNLDERETRAVIDELVRREVLAHEALRLGVLPDDDETTGRLADAMEAKLGGPGAAPTAEAVEREARRLAAGAAERATVDLVFVDKTRDGARARADAARSALARGEATVVDPPPVAAHATWTHDGLARAAGRSVADAAFATPVGAASEPVASAWGFFVVRPTERHAATVDEVRAGAVRAAEERARRDRAREATRRAAARYDVRVALPPGEDVPGASAGRWELAAPARDAEDVD